MPLASLPAHPAVPGRDVPVTPDADEARRWAEEELAKRIYHDQESFLDRLIRDVIEFVLNFLGNAGDALSNTPPAVTIGIIVAVLAVLVVVGLLVGGRIQLARARRARRDVELEADDRSAAELTRAADEAAAAGDLRAAVLQRFRALIRDLDERGLLEDRPGLTAREAARLAAATLPHLADDFASASDLFCDVRYGHREPTTGDDAALRELASRSAAGHRDRAGAAAGAAAPGAAWAPPGGDE